MTDQFVQIPKMGMSTVEVDIAELRVVSGQVVSRGDVLAVLESEKATVELESEVSGTVTEVRAAAGDVLNVGDVILVISAEADE